MLNNYTLLILSFIVSFNSFSQRKKNKQKITTEKVTYNNLSWRNIGPFRGGRSVASCQSSANLSHGQCVSASVSDPVHQHATSVDGVRLFTVPGPHHVPYGGAGGYPGTDWSMSNANTGISVSISQNNAGGSEARPRNVSMMYVIKI